MQNDEKERHPVRDMEPETTKNIAYAFMGLSLLLMVWFISQRAMKNRSSMLESNAPKIAGEDEMDGGVAIRNNSMNPMRTLLKKWPNLAKTKIQATNPESSITTSVTLSPRTSTRFPPLVPRHNRQIS